MADKLQELLGCSLETAKEALEKYGGVWQAFDALYNPPPAPEKRYKLVKPEPPQELSEQEERCQKGRELMDKLNALTSVAQSQMIGGQPVSGRGTAELPPIAELD
jgi:hypothetical protein